MIALLLAALLAPSAAAIDAEAPGAAALSARDAVEALPVPARLELRRMYLSYRDEVARRVEQGWSAGLLSDAVIEDVETPFQPARQLEDEERDRSQEFATLQAELAKTDADSPRYGALARQIESLRASLQNARKKNSREKGICRDWSDDAWSALSRMNLDHWTIEDRRRTSRPFHTGAVACSPGGRQAVCLVFDPWAEGKPSVYALQAWDVQQPGGRLPADYFLHGLLEKAR